MHIRDIYKTCKNYGPVLNINGNHSVNHVKAEIWYRMENYFCPYLNMDKNIDKIIRH